jgi:hypothetical protein
MHVQTPDAVHAAEEAFLASSGARAPDASSFRGASKTQTRNLEIPGSTLRVARE